MFCTKNRSSSWKWRWYFHQCWIYIFPIFDFNRPIYVLCRHHTFPWLGERCNYGVQNLSSHYVRYQKQILLLKMALIIPPMLNIYVPDFWFQKAYLCFMSTSYVSMTGRKMQLCCRKLNLPPSSVRKTDPPPEDCADVSTNVEYIHIPDFWFQKAYLCFMSTSYVFMTGRKMQLCCRKLKFLPCSVPKTDSPPKDGADISTNVEYIYSWFLISIGLSMFYVDIIRFHDWEKDASMVSKT